jgi:hypothetical protein
MARPPLTLALSLLFVGFAAWAVPPAEAQTLKLRQPAPEIGGGSTLDWINSPPLTMAGLKGRVVLIEFWTYG